MIEQYALYPSYLDKPAPKPERVKRRQDFAAWEAWEARQVEADRVWAERERLSEQDRIGGL